MAVVVPPAAGSKKLWRIEYRVVRVSEDPPMTLSIPRERRKRRAR
jgi:hypothetical protein